jgi:hypothetical protein
MVSLPDWTLWEIEYRREGGSVERPVTEELLARGSSTDTKQAISKLRLLKAHGWPVPRGSLDIEAVSSGMYVLKCKPGFWRLYFSVIDPRRRILLVLAVAKKKRKRNPNDLAKASRRLGDYQGGRARSCEVRLDD